MDFELTEDQRDYAETIHKFLQANCTRAHVRRFVDDEPVYDSRLWHSMANELGLHGIAIPEEHGGSGATFLELALVLEQTGRAMLCAPFFATVALAATALQCSGDTAAQARWLPKIASGELVATLAVAERTADPDAVQTTARQTSGGWVLDGHKSFVINGDSAALVLVAARSDAGLGLFAVEAPAAGLEVLPSPVLDPTRPMSSVDLAGVEATLIGVDGGAADSLRRTMSLAAIALAAEQVGGLQACLDMAVDYAGTRVQFGRPIGSFQAIKHKCADMFVDVETARCAVQFAAWSVAHGAGDEALLAEMTGVYTSEAFFRAAAQNLQIHGGIGYTWEHDAHLLFKRATASARLLGSSTERREKIAASIGL